MSPDAGKTASVTSSVTLARRAGDRLDARFRLAVDGRFVRAHPQPAARVPDDGGGCQHGGRRPDRRHRRGNSRHCQGFLGRALRSDRQAQAPGRAWLWSRRRHQADVPAREHGLGSPGRAIRRSHRQGDPRCPPRCPDRRHHAARHPWRELRHPPGAGYGWRVCRAAAGRGPDGALCRQLPRGVLVGAAACGARGAFDRRGRART